MYKCFVILLDTDRGVLTVSSFSDVPVLKDLSTRLPVLP
jgi:hypothetical protein